MPLLMDANGKGKAGRKPCPFCGGEGREDKQLRDGCKDGEPDAYACSIVCRSCASTGGWSKSMPGAWRLWNMRA